MLQASYEKYGIFLITIAYIRLFSLVCGAGNTSVGGIKRSRLLISRSNNVYFTHAVTVDLYIWRYLFLVCGILLWSFHLQAWFFPEWTVAIFVYTILMCLLAITFIILHGFVRLKAFAGSQAAHVLQSCRRPVSEHADSYLPNDNCV